MSEKVEAEFIEEDELKAPILIDATKLPTLVNVDDLIGTYEAVANIPTDAPIEDLQSCFLEIEKGFKAFRKARTSLETKRKEIGNPAYQFHKTVKRIADEVQSKINPFEEKLKFHIFRIENEEKRIIEEAEKKEELRISTIKSKIAKLDELPMLHLNSDLNTLKTALNDIKIVSETEYEEFTKDALNSYNKTVSQINTMINNRGLIDDANRLNDEAVARAEQERDKKAKEDEKKRLEFEAEKSEFEAEKAKFEAEKKAQKEADDLAKAVREAEELETEQAKEIAKIEEENRIAKKEVDELEAELLEKQKKKIWKAKKSIANVFVENGMMLENAENLVEQIANNDIEYLQIKV